jgi:hypothetical protein
MVPMLAARRPKVAKLIANPRLHAYAPVDCVDFEYLIHPRHGDDDAAVDGRRPARQSGPGAAGDDGDAGLMGDFDDGSSLLAGLR